MHFHLYFNMINLSTFLWLRRSHSQAVNKVGCCFKDIVFI